MQPATQSAAQPVQPATQSAAQPVQPAVYPAGEMTLQELQGRLGQIAQQLDVDKRQQLGRLIFAHGAARVSELDPAHYGQLLTEAEALING